MKTVFEHIKIKGIAGVVPESFINIDDEIEFFNNDIKLLERNKKILGLGKRHTVDDKTTCADLCEAAARDLIYNLDIDKDTIDSLIVASTSHDYFWPATSCVLHGRLNLKEDCTCFDMSGLACSAHVYGLQNAFSMIASGCAKRVLLLTSDLASTHSDRRNRNSNMLFGDAATATLIEKTDEECLSYFCTGSRGKGWDQLIAPAGGSALPIRADIADLEVLDSAGNVWHLYDDLMKGLEVFKFATEITPQVILSVLDMAHVKLEDVDYFAFHQANKQIVDSIARYVKIPKTAYSTEVFSHYGNCGSATVSLDILNKLCQQPLKLACLIAFGVGFSWGGVLVDLHDTKAFPIKTYKTPKGKMSRQEKIDYWINYFKAGNNA